MRARIVSCILIALTGCTGATGPDRLRVLGEIKGYNSGDPQILIVLQEGRRVDVSVTTYGGGCHSQGETEVDIQGLTVTVTPYDYTALPGTGCTRQLVAFTHRAFVQFRNSGTARVRVRGLDAGNRSAGNLLGDTLVVEQVVEVR